MRLRLTLDLTRSPKPAAPAPAEPYEPFGEHRDMGTDTENTAECFVGFAPDTGEAPEERRRTRLSNHQHRPKETPDA